MTKENEILFVQQGLQKTLYAREESKKLSDED